MLKYRFSLEKYVPTKRTHLKRVEKVVIISALNTLDAYEIIRNRYAGWTVSMFWPIVER